MKKFLIFYLILFSFALNIKALTIDGCDASIISRLRSEVNNINISYDYYMQNGEIYFQTRITNITPNLYFVDTYNNKTYYYSDTNNGEIIINDYYYVNKGEYKFYSALPDCHDKKIASKYYNFPIYNVYYNDEICEGISEFDACKKWVKKTYSYEELRKLTESYRESLTSKKPIDEEINYKQNIIDKIAKIYINYYYYFLIAIIVICLIIIIYKKRKDVLFK